MLAQTEYYMSQREILVWLFGISTFVLTLVYFGFRYFAKFLSQEKTKKEAFMALPDEDKERLRAEAERRQPKK